MLIGAAIGAVFLLMPHDSGPDAPSVTPAATVRPSPTPTTRPVATTRPATPTPIDVPSLSPQHREQAETLAFRAIADAAADLDDCEDEPQDCTDFAEYLAEIDGYSAVYGTMMPAGHLTGIVWPCTRGRCYAGLLSSSGGSYLVTGP